MTVEKSFRIFGLFSQSDKWKMSYDVVNFMSYDIKKSDDMTCLTTYVHIYIQMKVFLVMVLKLAKALFP
jgi:hypothetical protein